MKKIETEKVIKEKVITYQADDGTIFDSLEECKKYEETAKMVAYGMIKDKKIADESIYDLLDNGADDEPIEVWHIDTVETAELLNRYLKLATEYKSDANLIETADVGKDIIIQWSYDREYCWSLGSIEDYIEKIRKNYDKMIEQRKKVWFGENEAE